MQVTVREKKCILKIEIPGFKTIWNLDLSYEGNSTYEANVTAKSLDEALQRYVREIRRVSYNQGYGDAKSKRKKFSKFNDCFSQNMDQIHQVGW
jgi:hypothetical protein